MAQRARLDRSGGQFRFRLRYETLRSLLDKNGDALQLLSDLEADLTHFLPADYRVRRPLRRLSEKVLLMAEELNILAGNRYTELYGRVLEIAGGIEELFESAPSRAGLPLAVRLSDEIAKDPSVVGGKAAGISRLAQLFPESIRPAFVITTAAYRQFLEEGGLLDRIRVLLSDIEVLVGQDQFRARTQAIRQLIRSSPIPSAVQRAITEFAGELESELTGSGWAVRSSATSEDGRHSFAGQFESLLQVESRDLPNAYRAVLASRFTDRAVIYRLHCGFSEVETPMAVLFMPMVDPAAAGVIYTRDPRRPAASVMVVRAVPGLGDAVVRGAAEADVFTLSREARPALIESRFAAGSSPGYLSEEALSRIGAAALGAAEGLGHEIDMEWAIDREGRQWLLQGRRLHTVSPDAADDSRARKGVPLIEGGVTIFPGRSEGSVFWLQTGVDPGSVPQGCVLVVEHPSPELAAALPRIAALLAAGGNPVGHLATLLRELAIPSVFRLARWIRSLEPGAVISVDATTRRIYPGSRWPDVRERVLARIASAVLHPRSGPLHELVASFHLTDPYAPSFKVKNCRSLHDAIRFIHELSVRSVFGFGDTQARLWVQKKRSRQLHTNLPLRLSLIDLDGCVRGASARVLPEDVISYPFQALWRGFSDIRLPWPERWDEQFHTLPAGFREAVFGGAKTLRRRKDANYALVASDYLNLNARFAYHYAMIDATIGPGDRVNHVHFRLRGGGAAEANRVRRTRFLEIVLRQAQFGVDRQGDLIAAWLRRYPQRDSEEALELLGRLMVCARQLDLLMRHDDDINTFATLFLNGEYRAFA